VVLIIHPAAPTEGDIDAFEAAMRPLYARGQRDPMVTITDLCNVTETTARTRAKLAEAVNRLVDAHPGAKLGEAVVSASGVVRTLVAAHYMFRRDRGIPHEIFASTDEAVRWAHDLLHKHGAAR
jgi:hypothetical protein